MRVSKNRLSPIPAIRRDSAGAAGLRCRVVRKQADGEAPGRPDWSRIPSRRALPLDEEDWSRLIREQAARDAVHGRAMSGQSEKLLVDYVSQSSPDRRGVYEVLFRQYGDRLESYRAGDGSNMRNVNGAWEYDLTKAEARLAERFLQIYIPVFEAARGEYLAGGHMLTEI